MDTTGVRGLRVRKKKEGSEGVYAHTHTHAGRGRRMRKANGTGEMYPVVHDTHTPPVVASLSFAPVVVRGQPICSQPNHPSCSQRSASSPVQLQRRFTDRLPTNCSGHYKFVCLFVLLSHWHTLNLSLSLLSKLLCYTKSLRFSRAPFCFLPAIITRRVKRITVKTPTIPLSCPTPIVAAVAGNRQVVHFIRYKTRRGKAKRP